MRYFIFLLIFTSCSRSFYTGFDASVSVRVTGNETANPVTLFPGKPQSCIILYDTLENGVPLEITVYNVISTKDQIKREFFDSGYATALAGLVKKLTAQRDTYQKRADALTITIDELNNMQSVRDAQQKKAKTSA